MSDSMTASTSASLSGGAEAGRLVQRIPELWAAADLTERRRLLLTILDAVYVDGSGGDAIVTIRPKAAFAPLLTESQMLAV